MKCPCCLGLFRTEVYNNRTTNKKSHKCMVEGRVHLLNTWRKVVCSVCEETVIENKIPHHYEQHHTGNRDYQYSLPVTEEERAAIAQQSIAEAMALLTFQHR